MLQQAFHAGQPDKAGPPVLMSLHKQQQAVRSRSPSIPRSLSIPRQRGSYPSGQSKQHSISPFHQSQQQQQQQQQQQATSQMLNPPQQQGAQQAGSASQQDVISPLDPKFQALPEAKRVELLYQFLLAKKPNLQPLEVAQGQEGTSIEVCACSGRPDHMLCLTRASSLAGSKFALHSLVLSAHTCDQHSSCKW